MEIYNLSLDVSEFCVLCANFQGEFDRSRRALKCNRLGRYEKSYFLDTFLPLFEKIESIRLGRQVKYDLKTGQHYDI